MADDNGSEPESFTNPFDYTRRPVHLAFLKKKLPCPHVFCSEKVIFFEESGLDHHMRVIHNKKIDVGDIHNARNLLKNSHGDETLRCLGELFRLRSTQNQMFKRFNVKANGIQMDAFTKTATEAAKFIGVYLCHTGKLQAFSSGAESEMIEVKSEDLHVKFLAWFIIRDGKYQITLQSKYVRRTFLSVDSTLPLQEVTPTATPSIGAGIPQLSGDGVTDVLWQMFGYKSFRKGQEETIRSIMEGSDALIIMPTGGGKTLCYSIPAILSKGITIVVTPLLALMDDQVERLRKQRVNVCYIKSTMTEDEKSVVLHCLSQEDGTYDVLFITPEALLTPQLEAAVKKMSETGALSRIVVDEAHCIDTWGNDFRPSYSQLSIFKEHGIQIVAFTGTATAVTAQRIIDSLQLVNPKIMRISLERPNLMFTVEDKKESKSMQHISEMVVNKFPEMCGIVYCFATRDTLDMAYQLKRSGVKAVYYHGQLDLYERNNNATMWLEGRSDVMCATSAFGMGIDKKDVRFVIHHSMPKSMEEYFQEAGRAGRDGKSSSCILLFRFPDRVKLLKHISEIEELAHRASAKKRLDEITKYCVEKQCRKQTMLHYFDHQSQIDQCGICDVCINSSSEVVKNVTKSAIDVINCAAEILGVQPKVSPKCIIMVYRGHKTKDIVSKGLHTLPSFGKGKGVFKNDKSALKLLYLLVAMGFLSENICSSTDVQSTPFITVEEHSILLDGLATVMM